MLYKKMIEKIKSIFSNKDKRIENLIFLLIILIITLVALNSILKEDEAQKEKKKELAGAKLAEADNVSSSLEKRIENILSKISGVGNVSVLLTYSNDNLEGTIIVSEGAGDIKVKTNIINAVEAVTGLGKHKIQVYQMRREN